jgi:hypothetical protein
MTRGDDIPETGDFVTGWLMVMRARAVTQRWNDRYPKRQVPVEWAEEAARAWAVAEALGATAAGLDAQRYMLEFTVKLPIELIEMIWNGRDFPDELD